MRHPMHNTSEMKAILSEGFTSMQSLPVYSTNRCTRTCQLVLMWIASDKPIFTTGHDYRTYMGSVEGNIEPKCSPRLRVMDRPFCTPVRNVWACIGSRRQSRYA